jgi:hypothetical protein
MGMLSPIRARGGLPWRPCCQARENDRMSARFQIVVPRAPAAASPAPTELLTLPWPFSQRDLLTAGQFAKELGRRGLGGHGWDADVALLEELHRLRVLVPLFEIRRSGTVAEPVRIEPAEPLRSPRSTVLTKAYEAAWGGRLVEPGTQAFRPWPTPRQRDQPGPDRQYAYSGYQLLGLELAVSLLSALQPRARESMDAPSRWEIPAAWQPDEQLLDTMASWRALAVTLAAIDTVYWPPLAQRMDQDIVWRRARAKFDARQTAAWLGVTRDDVLHQADSLRAEAKRSSTLGDFYNIVWRGRPDALAGLRNGAAIELDLHVAAELLERFGEDIGGGEERPFPTQYPELRFGAPQPSLDATLTILHLSPHPSLVLALEGKTEMWVMPKVMKLLGVWRDPPFTQMVDIEGTRDLSLLAQYVGEPRFGAAHEDYVAGPRFRVAHTDYVLLDRPVTRFLILHDEERDYATPSARDAVRDKLLKAIAKRLPTELQPEVMHWSSRLVEIMTWGPGVPFEFAHFTDDELADGLLTAAAKPHPKGRDGLVHAIHQQRTRDRTPNIEDAWRASGVSKPQLAKTLWPVLESRVLQAMERGGKGPPVMQAALRARELAHRSRRSGTIIRKWPSGTVEDWDLHPPWEEPH